ncbi:hypothetical protein [Glycomyces sp. NPDC048151]|uniref:hypothetical protein n=1 Tax=Glycomyces sp. NPDC048151 TaxID=3364002 RepID=UPI00371C9B5F
MADPLSVPDLDDEPRAPDPDPIPGPGFAAVAALWLFATALGVGFLFTAVVLVFDLTADDGRAGVTAEAVIALVLGTLAALHAVVAAQLLQAREWARKAAVLIETGAVAASLVGTVAAFRLDAAIASQASGACLLAVLLHCGVIALVTARSVRDWCGEVQEQPGD